MKLPRWLQFSICCFGLLVIGLVKENYFIYLTIRMYGFEYNPIDHFKPEFYRFFQAIPDSVLKPLKYASFAFFAGFYYLYQLRTLNFFFPKQPFKKVFLFFFGGGPLPMILCFLFEETFSGKTTTT